MKKTYAFNSVEGDRKYNADDIAKDKAIFYSDGIVVQGGNVIDTQLKVTDVTGMQVKVDNGTAIIKGRTITFEGTEDGSELITLPQAHLTLDRIDRIVLELNLTDGVRDIVLKSIQGTPNAAPVAPDLVRNDEVYQISLAQIRVIANSGTIGAITDERSNSAVCGISNVQIGIAPPTGDSASTIVLSTTAQSYFGLDESGKFVDNALLVVSNAAYLMLKASLSADMLDYTFGKNNETRAGGIGVALAMIAYSTGITEVAYPLSFLKAKSLYNDILASETALRDLLSCQVCVDKVDQSPYAKAKLDTAIAAITDTQKKNAICYFANLNSASYANLAALLSDATAMATVAASQKASIYIANSGTMTNVLTQTVAGTAITTSSVAMTALAVSYRGMKAVNADKPFLTLCYNSATAVTAIEGSTIANTALLTSSILATASPAQQAFNTCYNSNGTGYPVYNNKCIVLSFYASNSWGGALQTYIASLSQARGAHYVGGLSAGGQWVDMCKFFTTLTGSQASLNNSYMVTFQAKYIPLQ